MSSFVLSARHVTMSDKVTSMISTVCLIQKRLMLPCYHFPPLVSFMDHHLPVAPSERSIPKLPPFSPSFPRGVKVQTDLRRFLRFLPHNDPLSPLTSAVTILAPETNVYHTHHHTIITVSTLGIKCAWCGMGSLLESSFLSCGRASSRII